MQQRVEEKSLLNYFNEVPNVILMLLSRANSNKKKVLQKRGCPFSDSSYDFKAYSLNKRQPKKILNKKKKRKESKVGSNRLGLLKLILMIEITDGFLERR